jgi:N-acetylmuramic acid 6-phosphate etherase
MKPSPTEAANSASQGIDIKTSREVIDILHREDRHAWEAVGRALEPLGEVVDRVAHAFRGGGRLLYVGAGTSGRLGVRDASACPPTFGVDPDLVCGVIAGGDDALRSAVEGAEDDPEQGAAAMRAQSVRAADVICGIAVSGSTPFVWGALAEARERGATTVLVTCNPSWSDVPTAGPVDVAVVLDVGPEVIAGSSRLKGGTATKLVLNTISTAAMIRCGKVYDNLMVDVVPANRKLRERAVRLVARVSGTTTERARELLELAAGRVKVAILMSRGLGGAEAEALLGHHGGILRRALEEIP